MKPRYKYTALLVMSLSLPLLAGCGGSDPSSELLQWTDPDTQISFGVSQRPTLVKSNLMFHVKQGKHEKLRSIDDDAQFSTIAFVRYENWLLIVCRGPDEVWAGFDYNTGNLYGEYDWAKLPFTHWAGQGTVVAEKKISDQSGSPANFPATSRPATQTGNK